MVEVQLVKSTEVIKTFKVEQNPEDFKTTFSVSCEYMGQEDYHNAQYELEQLGRDIKDLIFARNHPSAYVAVPVVTDEPMYKPGPLPCEPGGEYKLPPDVTEKCLTPGGVKVNRLTLFHIHRIVKEVLGRAAVFGSKEEYLDVVNQIVNRIADEAANDVLEGRGERVYLENQTFSMMEPTSDPIPLGCWSNESLLKVATGKVVSFEYNQLDAARELVFRLNSSMPEGIELRFTTDTFPNPALDAPAERAAQREVDSQVDSDDAVIKMEYLRSTRTQRFAIETTVEKGSELVCQTISVNTVVKTGDDVFVQTKNFKNGAQI